MQNPVERLSRITCQTVSNPDAETNAGEGMEMGQDLDYVLGDGCGVSLRGGDDVMRHDVHNVGVPGDRAERDVNQGSPHMDGEGYGKGKRGGAKSDTVMAFEPD